MPFEKRRPQMPKKRKKAKPVPSNDSDTEPDTNPPINPASSPPTNSDPRPVSGFHQSGHTGGHNCPYKDASTTHPVVPRCFKSRHVGHCPSCNSIVSFQYGCHNHHWAKDMLSERAFREEELIGPKGDPKNLEARWPGKRGK